MCDKSKVSSTKPHPPSCVSPFSQQQQLKHCAKDKSPKFREFQSYEWTRNFYQLCEYRRKHGHTMVPHNCPENPSLGRWVKRQRYQYKLWRSGSTTTSTMTAERAEALASIDFVWDQHSASWWDSLQELRQFKAAHGHCKVPVQSTHYAKLATWIKCQRRQYKLFRDGRPSYMNEQRIAELEKVGLKWEIRGAKKPCARV
jgi:hypothetical protein